MIKDTSKLKDRIRENTRMQEDMFIECIREGSKDKAMYHVGHMRGLDNALGLIEIWEKDGR